LFKNTGIDIDCPPEKNLIIRAYRLLADRFDLPAIHVHLHKLIPFGAGLGGGSSDAAFMLKALNDFFELHLSDQILMELASNLGSDCAFFIKNHPAFATGKGECLEEIELSLADYQMILVKPTVGVSTPEAYAGISPQQAPVDLRELKKWPVSAWKGLVYNDFEKTVFGKYPQIACIKEQLYKGGALYASMTGSGSAVYGFFEKGKKIDLSFPDCFVWQQC
jgi:4-diphosphocytidyl-2-C-methyl-D-erythritol kinase